MSKRSDQDVTLERKVWFERITNGQRVVTGENPGNAAGMRVPSVTKMMALVIRYDQLLNAGHICNLTDLCDLAGVTHARITQIMGLRHLAPDIQEAILFLPRTPHPVDPISERAVRPIAVEPDWSKQRKLWQKLVEVRLPRPG